MATKSISPDPSSPDARVVGRPLPRIEDRPLVAGNGRYAGDINFPRQLHMRIVRAPFAHARLKAVDVAAARALPGVVAVWTHDDIAELPPIDFRGDRGAESLKPYRQPVLATKRMRYVGDPVAAVFAEDPYVAEDAAELVVIDAEPLPVITAADAEPGTFDDDLGSEAALLSHTYGDAAAAFAKAAHVIELDLHTGRHSGVPMECRGAIGFYDASRDILELHGAAKVPHRNKETLCRMLGREPGALHVHEAHVGGGFGIRGELYPEDVLVLVGALRFGRPVKWIEDRQEHLMCANQGREQRHLAKLALDADGRILALKDEIFHDQGGYVRTHGANVPNRTMCMLTGPYQVPDFRAEAHFRLTNKTPCATYRAPGRFESTFVRERLMDAAAEHLGLDRLEIRRRNLIAASDMPFEIAFEEPGVEELLLDSGDYELLLDKALKHFGWDEALADCARRRAAGDPAGLGIGMFVEEAGRGPRDGARITIDATGGIEVLTGGASVGQGFETIMAQLTAEHLGVDYRTIRVLHGQTDLIPYGIGAHAARATVMTGGAVDATARKLRARVLEAASDILQTPVDSLTIEDATVIVADNPNGPSVTLAEVAEKLAPGSSLLDGRNPGLTVEAFFNSDHTVFPYGVHLAQVAVDPGTGRVTVERFLVAYDVGRAINPLLVEGQLVGGAVQGLGGALYEEFAYSDTGEPLAVTFADYLMPTLAEASDIDVLLTEDAPSPHNPVGMKGAGEGGINGVGAAIAGAIDQAIGIPGAITRLPVTPQRLKALLAEAKG